MGSIDDEGELLDYAYRDLQVSQTAMQISRQCFVVMDRDKFDSDAMVRLGHLSQIDALFTNARPPAAVCRTMRANRVKLHVAKG